MFARQQNQLRATVDCCQGVERFRDRNDPVAVRPASFVLGGVRSAETKGGSKHSLTALDTRLSECIDTFLCMSAISTHGLHGKADFKKACERLALSRSHQGKRFEVVELFVLWDRLFAAHTQGLADRPECRSLLPMFSPFVVCSPQMQRVGVCASFVSHGVRVKG